jgi:histidinol dehydrogenase
MRIRRLDWREFDADVARGWWGGHGHGDSAIHDIETAVATGGDGAVMELTARYDAPDQLPERLRVEPGEPERALDAVDASVREALEVAAENIRAVADAQVDTDPRRVELEQGHAVAIAEVPVAAVGVYAPGGRAGYPSSVLMCCVPARVAGVDRIAVASPPGRDGHVHPVVLAACAVAGVDEVYAMGGAQAIFALARGTESVAPVDLIVGPGSSIVQEAKRMVYGEVGLDSIAGPSELMVIADATANPALVAFDLCAQAEHGDDSPLMATAPDAAWLDDLQSEVGDVASQHPTVTNAPLALVEVPDLESAVELANLIAPEHLQLICEGAEEIAGTVRTAGCVFVGPWSATAFGDYAAGSNHVLPTGGAGRFAGPLSPRTFMRQIATVEISAAAATALAPHVRALAEAEGFPVHGESAMARAEGEG